MVRQALAINDELLLCMAWIRDDERRMASMFPQVFACDVTEQTNKEKRPLLLVAGLTSEKKTFTVCRAYLPSLCRWAFDWFFTSALPILLPEHIRNRIAVMYTDGDRHMYLSYESVIPRFYPSSCHRLCAWHLINRAMLGQALNAGGLSDEGKAYFLAAVKWIKSWGSAIESLAEYSHSYNHWKQWLQSTHVREVITGALADRLLEFVLTTMEPHRERWARYNYMRRRTYDRLSTQFCEVENAVMKTGPMAVKPSQSIDTAASTMNKQSTDRLGTKFQKAAFSVDTTPTSFTFENREFEKSCTSYAVREVAREIKRVPRMEVIRRSPSSFLVRYKYYREERRSWNDPKFFRDIVPRYDHVREITVVQCTSNPEEQHLDCSCGKFQRFGFPCAHIYAVLCREPEKSDASVQHHKLYAHCYQHAMHQELTGIFDQALQREPIGPRFIETGFPLSSASDIDRLERILLSNVPVVCSGWTLGPVGLRQAPNPMEQPPSASEPGIGRLVETVVLSQAASVALAPLPRQDNNCDGFTHNAERNGNDDLYPAADDDTGEEAESDDGTWNTFELHDNGLTIFKDMVKNAKYNKATRRAFQDVMYSAQAQVLAALASQQPKKRAPSPASPQVSRMASSNLESERCLEPIRIPAKGSAKKKKCR